MIAEKRKLFFSFLMSACQHQATLSIPKAVTLALVLTSTCDVRQFVARCYS